MSELYDIAKSAIQLSQKLGAKEVSASTYRSRDVEVQWRDGKVEKVSEATTRGLSLALYVDGRYSAVATNDMRKDALETFIRESISMAKTLAVDPHRALPDPKYYEGRAKLDLALADPKYEELTADTRRRLAQEIEEAARAPKGNEAILSVTTGVSDSRSESARVTSNGFEGEMVGTSFFLSAETSVKDPDGRRPEGSHSGGSRFFTDLPKPADVGRLSTERALGSIGSIKIPSAKLPLIVENRVSARLVRPLFGALGGRAIQQKQSFLDGQLGKPIANKLLTINDDPFIPKGFGSRLWNGDGFATKKFPVIEKGVLKTYFIDDYYARKLGVAPTTGGSTNSVFALGTKGLDALLADVKEGILVTGFLGGNSNGLTGDFSFGVQGFHIEKGKPTKPLSEMNISGNMKDFWQTLAAVGNDPYPYSTMLSPTFVFDGVQFAGA